MRIGVNEVIIYERSSGTRQREINMLPEVLRQVAAAGGQSVVYLARDLGDETAQRLVGDAPAATVVRTPVPTLPTAQRLVRGALYFPRQARRDRLDLFHTSYFPIPRVQGIPIVLTVNDVRFVHFPETYQPARLRFLRWSTPRAVRRADRIITISQDTKNDLVRHFGALAGKVDVVPVAADPRFRRVTDASQLAAVQARYALPARFILYVGHLEPRKNLTRLVQAYIALRREDAAAPPLVILGKASFGFEPVLALVRQQGLESQVSFTGYVEDADLPAVYSLAEMLAFPSLHEGFGVPLLEAMGCETPIVTSNVSAMPEVAGDAALLVDPRDVDSIAQGMAALLRDEALRRTLVQNGLRRLQEFSVERLAATTLACYRKALADYRA